MGTSEDAGIHKVHGRPIEETQIGIWRLWIEKKAGFDPREHLKNWTADVPVVLRLVSDVYTVAPGLCWLIGLVKVWSSVEPVVLLYLSSHLLKIIEAGLKEGRPDASAIIHAAAARLILLCVAAVIGWWSDKVRPRVKHRVKLLFDDRLLRSQLRTDLPTVHDNISDSELSSGNAWYTCESLIDFGANFVSAFCQLGFVLQMSRSNSHGPLFALACVASPLLKVTFRRSLWDTSYVVKAENEHFVRMRALKSLGKPKYRQDVISGNIMEYVLEEYGKAKDSMGDISSESVERLYYDAQSPFQAILTDLASDLPMIYYAVNAILNPAKFTLASIALLQQSSTLLRNTFFTIFYESNDIRKRISRVKQLYNAEDVKNIIKDGELAYPLPERTDEPGMAFELRNVTFAYPGSKTTTNALTNVSVSIKAGQLVAIVGANGSGKSTIIKLLTRLYDATEGQVVVDGQDIQRYKMVDFRQAVATLTQDHHLYPLSIAENIGLGDPDRIGDMDVVARAAKAGGAEGVIAKLAQGYSTVLDSVTIQYGLNVKKEDKTPLAEKLRSLEKTVDVSGGERQRLVASRTFMCFNSGKVRFVAVDEPSSALDPEGELELFDNLRSARPGKTMVFVTHRFGHLTKHADLIICMKDGRVVESGTHQELVAIAGEYLKLYDIQASAFSHETT